MGGTWFDRIGNAYAATQSGLLRYRATELTAVPGHLARRVVDGDLAEWQDVPAYGMKGGDAIRVDGASPAPLDGSAVIQAAWDADNLYFALRVYDDSVVTDSTGKPWQDDSVELGIDGNHDHARNWDRAYDRQFTVNAQGAVRERQPLGSPHCRKADLPDGYVLELRSAQRTGRPR